VLAASYKVTREIHRLEGLLRFAPDIRQVYTARCAPDHFVLPSLADHFFKRFGDIPWVILDEKRELAVVCSPGGEPRLMPAAALPSPDRALPDAAEPAKEGRDPWETMWQNYHRVINNESRRNPSLQRQFMPVRYWKYLNEV
jgi:probable DNA metabolism protein